VKFGKSEGGVENFDGHKAGGEEETAGHYGVHLDASQKEDTKKRRRKLGYGRGTANIVKKGSYVCEPKAPAASLGGGGGHQGEKLEKSK